MGICSQRFHEGNIGFPLHARIAWCLFRKLAVTTAAALRLEFERFLRGSELEGFNFGYQSFVDILPRTACIRFSAITRG